MNKARRYNKGKTRYELIPTEPLKYLADVYTRGAHKYSIYEDDKGDKVLGKDIPLEEVSKYKLIEDGSENWRLGQKWKESMGSVKRHIEAWEEGEDIDVELKTRHLANAAWGLFSLMEFERTHPELDNRHHKYLHSKRIGLDIDEVICDFTGGWSKLHGVTPRPTAWNYHREMSKCFKEMQDAGTLEDFYLSLQPKIDQANIPFEPCCYVTSRPIPSEVTEKWISMHGFPTTPVITVKVGESKVEALKKAGVEIFVDDNFMNFTQLNNAGICCYLFDAPHNQRYEVGTKRIKTLKELP